MPPAYYRHGTRRRIILASRAQNYRRKRKRQGVASFDSK